ncbi:MAG: hypothetical protein IT304_01135 [Dehalococcoidia bacterium]|nr:hypothetical protein [Dehalococcoidia bacterium]
MSAVQAPERGRQRAVSRAWRLSPAWRKAALTLHVVASVALIGTTASVVILAVRAASAESAEARALYESAGVLAFALAIPFSMASLASGLLLGFGTPWGVLRYYWVVAKMALLLAIILVGALGVGPSLQDLADRAAEGGAGAALGSRRWQLALLGAANLLFAVAAVVLSIFKPWGRIRSHRPATTSTTPR